MRYKSEAEGWKREFHKEYEKRHRKEEEQSLAAKCSKLIDSHIDVCRYTLSLRAAQYDMKQYKLMKKLRVAHTLDWDSGVVELVGY